MLSLIVSIALIAAGSPTSATAQEVKEIAIAQQFGAIFIPLMAMEDLQLVEKQATARGIGLKVNWAKLAGPSVMVDAILSGNLHFSAQGVPSLALMWDRTKGGIGVRAVSAITNTDIYLNTRNPNIRSIRDFTERDRIAVPSVKVSTQAISPPRRSTRQKRRPV
jgi:NitT/TauT family transport system substrate-binding protein